MTFTIGETWKCQNLKVSVSIFVSILKVSESECLRIWKFQNLKVSKPDSVRIYLNVSESLVTFSFDMTLSSFKEFWHYPVSDTFRFDVLNFWHLPVTKDSDTFRLWHFPAITFFHALRFWHLQVSENSDTIWFWHFQILTISDSDTFRFWYFQDWNKIVKNWDSDTFSPLPPTIAVYFT